MTLAVEYTGTRDVTISELRPFPGNAKKHDIPALRASLREGQYQAIVVREHDDGTLTILAGHGTTEAAGLEGWTTIRAEVLHCDDRDARRINIKANRLPELAGYNKNLLAELLVGMEGDLAGTGFTDSDLDELLRVTDHLGNQATALLDQALTAADPLDEGHGAEPAAHGGEQTGNEPDDTDDGQSADSANQHPGPGQATTSSSAPAVPSVPSLSPPPRPTPGTDGHVQVSWVVPAADRDLIQAALRTAQHNGAPTSAHALVQVARHYLDTAAAPEES